MKLFFACDRNFVTEALRSVHVEDVEKTEINITNNGLRVKWVNEYGITAGKVFTESELVETHFNHLAESDGRFYELVKKHGVTFAEYYKALNHEIKIMEENGTKPDYDNLFTETLEMMCEGRIPWKTDADVKAQKNENAKRNKKKTEELKAGNDKQLPGVDGEETADDNGEQDVADGAGGVPEDTGGADDRDNKDTKADGDGEEETIWHTPVIIPRGFRLNAAEKALGLTREQAYLKRQEEITPLNPDEPPVDTGELDSPFDTFGL